MRWKKYCAPRENRTLRTPGTKPSSCKTACANSAASPAVRHWPVLHCLNLKCLNLAPKLLRTIQILHDANMANTKQCVSMLQMTTILKRCADELDQTSAEIASGSPSKRQRKQVANHQMVLAKAVRAVCVHQEQQVASTKGNGSSRYVLSVLQAEERRNKRAAGILSSDRSETRKELLQFCRQQSDLGELPTPIGLRQREENASRIVDVRKRADALRQLKPNAKYTASWAIPKLASLPTEHNIRGEVIRAWSADHGNGLCPVTQRQLQKSSVVLERRDIQGMLGLESRPWEAKIGAARQGSAAGA